MPTCRQCGEQFIAARSTARFCSPLCRLRAHRGFARTKPKVPEPEAPLPQQASTELAAIELLRDGRLLTNRYAPFIGQREIRCTVDDVELDDDDDPVYTGRADDSTTITLTMYRDGYGDRRFAYDMEGPDLEGLSDADWARLLRQRIYAALLDLDDKLDAHERQALQDHAGGAIEHRDGRG